MKEIKFRGKLKDKDPTVSKRWAYGGLFYVGERAFIVLDDVELLTAEDTGYTGNLIDDFVEVIPESVGQFTGSYDINGKSEIYEDDLLSHFGHTKYATLWRVFFQGGCFQVKEVKTKRIKRLQEILNYVDTPEKIGNIHSNPELSEAQNG